MTLLANIGCKGALEKRLATVVEIYRGGIWMRPGNYIFCVKCIKDRLGTLKLKEK
jgi:hypothetical protein